jgi:hypothetical protein
MCATTQFTSWNNTGSGHWPLAVIELSGVAVILGMMLHIVANAFSRTVRDVPLDNTLEITEFWYMPALALMGLAACAESADLDLAPLLGRRTTRSTHRAGRADPAADGPRPRWR